jgi:predicted TIM-barrel fold metal-dependent hydrolase
MALFPLLFSLARSLTALFDSDYTLIAPDRRLEDFEKIAIRDNVRPLILKENAMRLFGLA